MEVKLNGEKEQRRQLSGNFISSLFFRVISAQKFAKWSRSRKEEGSRSARGVTASDCMRQGASAVFFNLFFLNT